jgi:hypothetical protein
MQTDPCHIQTFPKMQMAYGTETLVSQCILIFGTESKLGPRLIRFGHIFYLEQGCLLDEKGASLFANSRLGDGMLQHGVHAYLG